MDKTALFPPGSEFQAGQIKVSPGILSGDHVFLTGVTGSRSDGSMRSGIEDQTKAAFDKIGAVLAEAGLSHNAIVEMTSYHVGLREHFNAFNRIRCEYMSEPFPALTAIDVAGLRRPGALIEIRAIASCAR